MNDVEPAIWSRILTAETLAFHIIWATIGVGVPIFISIAEGWGLWKKDSHYILMAKRWARGFVITVAIGVVTGSCIGFMLSLLWPKFMQFAGNIISLPLFMETFAFFFEAIFLGIYLYTWDRFHKPIIHWLTSIPIVIGSTMSAVFITTVNAFQNTPTGFTLNAAGKVTSIHPLGAMLNPATPTKVAHVLATSYLTCGFLLAGIAAFCILRKRTHPYYKKSITLTMILSLVLSVLTIITGDLSAKFLAQHQPIKLAAAEWHFETQAQAPLVIGGTLNKETLEIKHGLKIPYALSILSFGNKDAEVKGLLTYPRVDWPPLYIHYLFDIMVGIGIYLLLVAAWFLFLRWRKPHLPWRNHVLISILIGAPLAFIAVECGWILAEVGRQPWIIVGIMRAKDAATSQTNVDQIFWLFTTLYAVLAIIAVTVLRRLFRNKPAEEELRNFK